MNTMSILLSSMPEMLDEFNDIIAVVLVFAIPIIGTILLFGLPIMIAMLIYRHKVNDTNMRAKVILAAMDKYPGAVPEELINSLNKPQKSVKERLLGKLLWGCLFSLSGLAIVATALFSRVFDSGMFVFGILLLAVGVAFLIYYFVGRRQLRTQIEAEEQKLLN